MAATSASPDGHFGATKIYMYQCKQYEILFIQIQAHLWEEKIEWCETTFNSINEVMKVS